MGSRRYFLRASSLLPTAWWSRFLPARTPPVARNEERLDELAGYCDTLLPADDSPAASELGVHRLLIEQAAQDPELARALAGGLDWLAAQARAEHDGRAFAELDEEQREALLARAAQAPTATTPRYFFDLTSRLAFEYYYRNPAAWKALNYGGPPQPLGFADYTRPPSNE